MPAAKFARPRTALETVILDVEDKAAGAVAGEEILDRLGPLTAGAGRANPGAERDQRATEVAALGVASGRGADVSAERRVAPHLAVGDVPCDVREHLVRCVGQCGNRNHRADHDAVVVGAELIEAASVEHQGAFENQSARRDLGQQNRSTGVNRDARAVAVQGGRLVGGRRKEHVDGHVPILPVSAVTRKCARSYCAFVAFASIDELDTALAQASYLADRGLATALFLALTLEKPLLLEGEAGVGKTEAAKAIATAVGAPLIRLQCYEGLDIAHAVYEWNYARQLLHIRAAQAGTVDEGELFGPEFLIRRPVLEALESEERVLLLIDEIDRADEEFEAFLLEVLSDFQVTIPELGTITARQRPYVILTSNRTRELHDALKRRCLYHWIDHPSVEREIQIVELRVPGVPQRLAEEAARFAAELRSLDLQKPPGLAETIDWVRALTALGQRELDVENVEATLGSLLKYHEDVLAIRDEALAGLVRTARG